ncbi:uncharacterized protein PpBr36_05601 [Pyricularia pennisetigena]|uniref:uncharacterized protein n=1 Tax=Pyricularia pennisetigena TaxID=1578925 RepID=UPI0011518130|nr:uncharacterized protein PpBr36_05601 [Pyricularia pennisetigena]TLS23595.1 hypothetical protein PpBr36_05601 [Pyricularia pennisetigena]
MSASANAYRKAARQMAQKAANNRTARAALAQGNNTQMMDKGIVGSFMLPGTTRPLFSTGSGGGLPQCGKRDTAPKARTLIAPPVFRSIFQSPTEGAKLQLDRVKTKSMDAFRMVASYIASKPSVLASGRLQIQRGQIVPTAKELHRSLSKAFAAGDLDTLRRVCLPSLYQMLSAKVLQRPTGIRRQWELVSYTSTLMYPRIVDHKLMEIPRRDGTRTTAHQAVVTIRSRQRLAHFNDKTGVSTGPPKELDVTEHLIMMRELDSNASTPSDWKVFGYADETTYQSWQEEKRGLELLAKQGGAQ